MLENLIFIAPTRGRGGYEVHSREVLRHLYRRKINLQHMCLNFSTDFIAKDKEINKILEETMKNKVPLFSPVLWLTLPQNVRFSRGGPIINYCAWEADRIIDAWVFIARAIDLTILTNSFLKDVWIDSGVSPDRVEYVGEGTDPQKFNSSCEKFPLSWRGKRLVDIFEHRFIMCSELSNRKNVTNAIKAFVKAFEGRKDVCLILKASYMSIDARIEHFLGDVNMRKANIFLYDQVIPDELFPQFLNNATHYYTLSRGEGWDLTCVDMGAMNKIVVAPYHTAYKDYLDDNRAFLIKKMQKVPAVQNNFLDTLFRGSRWFEPDFDEAVDALRASVNNLEEAKGKAVEFNKYVVENLTWQKQVDKLYGILNERFG